VITKKHERQLSQTDRASADEVNFGSKLLVKRISNSYLIPLHVNTL